MSRTDALGGVEKITYDAVGNLLGETDAVGNTTSMKEEMAAVQFYPPEP